MPSARTRPTMGMICQAAALIVICLFQPSLQAPELASSCTQGPYVNNGYISRRITCSCSDRDADVSKVYWTNSSGVDVSRTSLRTYAYLDVNFRETTSSESYRCHAEYSNSSDRTLPYTVRFAYGPKTVTVDLPGPSFDLCPGTSDTLDVTCNASSNNPSPPLYEIFTNGTAETTTRSYSYERSRLIAGLLNVTCVATNIKVDDFKLDDLSKSGTGYIIVREPPPDPPVIKFNDSTVSNIKQVDEGSFHTISCSVSGGFPLVSKVNVKCNSQIQQGNGFTFTKSYHDTNCTCSADHESGCYNKVSSIKLNVHYTPQVTFTINGRTESVTVPDGSNVTLRCDVDANPQVDHGTIKRENIDESVMETQDKQEELLTVGCSHTDVYYCFAENTFRPNISTKIQINVQCPTQLENPSDNMSDIVSASETHHIFNQSVIGYPEPQEPYVLHAQDVCDSGKTTVVDTELYTVEYTHIGGARGMLEVNFSSLTIKDFTTYYLEINNTVEPVQVYAFRLIHPNKETYECESVNLALIIGVVVAIIVVIVVVAIIIGVILHRRRRRRKEDSPPPSVVGGRTGAIPNAYAGDSLTRPSGTFDSLDSFRPATAHPYQPMEVNGAASSPANGTYANVSVGGESSNPVIGNPNGPSHIPDEPSSDRPPSYQAPPVPMKKKPDKSVPQSLRRPIYDTPPVREDTGGAGIYDNINRPPPAHHPASPTSDGNYVNVGSKKKPPVAVKPKKKPGQTGHNDQDTPETAGNTDEMYENLGFLNDDGVSNNNHGVPQHGAAEGRFRPLPGENQLYNNVQLGHDGGETGHYTNVNLGR